MNKGDYFCPGCGEYFDTPEDYVSPCCGVSTDCSEDYICPECGNKFDENMEIRKCPYCGNIGGGGIIDGPDCTDCFRPDHREEIRKRRGLSV